MNPQKNTRQMNKWMIMASACMVCFSIFSSCTYGVAEEDWTKNGKVRLILDWQGATHPEQMDYYFYREGSSRPVIRRVGANGFEGTLPSGTYRVMACNPDPYNILLDTDNGYEKANGMVKQITVLKSSSSSLSCPNRLLGCGSGTLKVGGEEATTTTLHPADLIRTLELHMKITKGGKEEVDLSGLSGYLTGVSTGVNIPTGAALSGTPGFVAFEPECTGKGKYRALLTLFGLADMATDGKPAGIYLTLKGKENKQLTTWIGIPREVGDMFRQKTASRVILDLTVAYDQVNGLSTSLEEWKEGTGESGVTGNGI